MPATCPECHSANVRRSQRRTRVEYVASWFRLLPWRCKDCEKRFFHFAAWAPNPLPRDHRRHDRSWWERLPLPIKSELVGYALGAVLTLAFVGWLVWGGLD